MKVKTMPHTDGARERGFTIIELLTVIAIMAILMALIFPLASGMRERGNQTSCIGNLESIGQALKMYRLDERDYPLALYGYTVDTNDNGQPDEEPTTFLYPHYIRARREFKCPDNPNRDNEYLFAGPFAGTKSPGQVPLVKVPKPGGGYSLAPSTNHKIFYSVFDSYDGGVLLPRNKVPGPTAPPAAPVVVPLMMALPTQGSPQYEQHFRREWYSLYVPNGDLLNPLATRELLYRNPEDSTYVTTCSYHRDYRIDVNGHGQIPSGGHSTDIVLFLDGHTEKLPSAEVAMGPMIQPHQS